MKVITGLFINLFITIEQKVAILCNGNEQKYIRDGPAISQNPPDPRKRPMRRTVKMRLADRHSDQVAAAYDILSEWNGGIPRV